MCSFTPQPIGGGIVYIPFFRSPHSTAIFMAGGLPLSVPLIIAMAISRRSVASCSHEPLHARPQTRASSAYFRQLAPSVISCLVNSSNMSSVNNANQLFSCDQILCQGSFMTSPVDCPPVDAGLFLSRDCYVLFPSTKPY